MSFGNTRLDSDEFPYLNMANQMAQSKVVLVDSSSSGCPFGDKDHEKFLKFLDLKPDQQRKKLNKQEHIESADDVLRCRVGLKIGDYHQDLNYLLKTHQIGDYGDFINVFIEPIRAEIHQNEFELIPDLVLPSELWSERICLEIVFSSAANLTPNAIRKFEQIFFHALYLSALVIVITSPNSEQAHAAIATVVNQSILKSSRDVIILFKIPLQEEDIRDQCNLGLEADEIESSSGLSEERYEEHDYESELKSQDKSPVKQVYEENWITSKTSNDWDTSSSSETKWTAMSGFPSNSPVRREPVPSHMTSWQQWSSLSTHLGDDTRFGVCLSINQDLTDNVEELNRWTGVPIRMITVNVNRFSRRTFKSPIMMESNCQAFIKKLISANSLRTSIVLEGAIKENVREYLLYLDYMLYRLRTKRTGPFVNWNDRIQQPLQPLSYNLDSGTYGVFEMDSTKYIKYREAMIEALIRKNDDLTNLRSAEQKIVLMVLGAGRGPLVDCFIDAIKSITTKFKFKIYALDKNTSSVRSLRYKLHNNWQDKTGLYEVKVIESDMRVWNPDEKADIIATELLGSFSDNELSPECIDGTWRFSTPETFSIPQEYSSFLAPIYSCKFRQKLIRKKLTDTDVYDKIYVDKLVNYYVISEPQELFNFQHKDLSREPFEGKNERYKRLSFWSKVHTTCHGFAGYFRAHLFGNIEISTLYGYETPNMYSWFPAAIPLEQPIDMPPNTRMDVHFWRKESQANVWYQWLVTHPQRSRPHSGEKSAMSKFV